MVHCRVSNKVRFFFYSIYTISQLYKNKKCTTAGKMPKRTDILMRLQQRQNNEERFLRLQTTCGLQITHQCYG